MRRSFSSASTSIRPSALKRVRNCVTLLFETSRYCETSPSVSAPWRSSAERKSKRAMVESNLARMSASTSRSMRRLVVSSLSERRTVSRASLIVRLPAHLRGGVGGGGNGGAASTLPSSRPHPSRSARHLPREGEGWRSSIASYFAATHRNRRAVRCGRAVAAEPGDGAGDFVGGDEAALRVLRVERGFGFFFAEPGLARDILCRAGDDVGFDVAGADGVDS